MIHMHTDTPPTPAQQRVPRIEPGKRTQGRRQSTRSRGICLRAWNALRQLTSQNNNITIGDLLDIVATGREKNAFSSIYNYLARLERHGVLGRRAKLDHSNGTRGQGMVIWYLKTDPGFHAPIWRARPQQLWNPNTQTAIALIATAQEDAA